MKENKKKASFQKKIKKKKKKIKEEQLKAIFSFIINFFTIFIKYNQ